jgi:hypothetical protein
MHKNFQNMHIKIWNLILKLILYYFKTNKSTFNSILCNHVIIHLQMKAILKHKSWNEANIFSLQVGETNGTHI